MPGEGLKVASTSSAEDGLNGSPSFHARSRAAERSVDEGSLDDFVGAGERVKAAAGLCELDEVPTCHLSRSVCGTCSPVMGGRCSGSARSFGVWANVAILIVPNHSPTFLGI